MPYAAFVRLLEEFVGFDAGEPLEETIGHYYTMHNASGVNLASLEGVPSNRICLGQQLAFCEHQFNSIEEFIENERGEDPGAEFEVLPFSKNIEGNMLWDPTGIAKKTVTFKGVKVVRKTLPFVTANQLTGGGEDDQALRDLTLSGKWSDILEDVGFGLRLSYVFPEDMWDGVGTDAVAGGLSHQLKAALNPHVTSEGPGLLNQLAYLSSLPSGVRVPILGSSGTTYESTKGMRFCHKTHHFKEAVRGDGGSGPREVYILPLASVELGSEDLPNIIKEGSFSDLRAAYPIVDDTPKIPYGKQVFDKLYKRLKTDSKFKLLFEYIFPSKRLLALNTILNIENFEQFFTNKCAFKSMFNPTRQQIGEALELAFQGGGIDVGEPYMPDVTESLGELGADVFQEFCPPNTAALGKYLAAIGPRAADLLTAATATAAAEAGVGEEEDEE